MLKRKTVISEGVIFEYDGKTLRSISKKGEKYITTTYYRNGAPCYCYIIDKITLKLIKEVTFAPIPAMGSDD